MSFQVATYQKAMEALARDDPVRLKALIRQPVHESHKRAQGYVMDLAAQAAARGNVDALEHLMTVVKVPSLQRELLLRTWVEANEHQRDSVNQWAQAQLSGQHGQHPFDLYVHACRRRHWKSALTLLDHGDVPANGMAARHTIWPLRSDTEKADVDQEPLREVAEHLMPHFSPAQVASSTIIAMRLHLDTWVDRLLTGAQADAQALESRSAWDHSDYVAQEAVAQERLDWLVKLYAIQRSSVFWVTQLKWAASQCPTLDLIARTLNTVDEATQQLKALPGSITDLVSMMLRRHDPIDPTVRTTVQLLLRGQDLDQMRQDMAESHRRHLPNLIVGDAELNVHLNRLFLCAPADTRKQWLTQEPQLFAPAQAQLRQELAATRSPTSDRVRPRIRA